MPLVSAKISRMSARKGHAALEKPSKTFRREILGDRTMVKVHATIGSEAEQRPFEQRPYVHSALQSDRMIEGSSAASSSMSSDAALCRIVMRRMTVIASAKRPAPSMALSTGSSAGSGLSSPRLQLHANIRRHLFAMGSNSLVLAPIRAQFDQVLWTPGEFLRVSLLQVVQ